MQFTDPYLTCIYRKVHDDQEYVLFRMVLCLIPTGNVDQISSSYMHIVHGSESEAHGRSSC